MPEHRKESVNIKHLVVQVKDAEAFIEALNKVLKEHAGDCWEYTYKVEE